MLLTRISHSHSIATEYPQKSTMIPRILKEDIMIRYEEPIIEIVTLSSEDVITTSAFNGSDDSIEDWT